LRGLRSPEELLGLFDEKALRRISQLFQLPDTGDREELSQALIAFVERTNTVSLANFMEDPQKQAAGPVAKPDSTTPERSLEISNETLLKAIERCPFPKIVKTERSGRDLLLKHLAKTFGRAQITPNRTVGRHLVLKADIDVMERFGILVRLGRSMLGKKASDLKKTENVLGKVVLLAGSYGRGNLFIILLGEIPKNQGSAFGELRAWMESVGGRTLQR